MSDKMIFSYKSFRFQRTVIFSIFLFIKSLLVFSQAVAGTESAVFLFENNFRKDLSGFANDVIERGKKTPSFIFPSDNFIPKEILADQKSVQIMQNRLRHKSSKEKTRKLKTNYLNGDANKHHPSILNASSKVNSDFSGA